MTSWILAIAGMAVPDAGAQGWSTNIQAWWDAYGSALGDPSSMPPNGLVVDLALGVITFVDAFLIGGCVLAFLWGATTLQGAAIDEGRKEEGKKIMINAAIGLVFGILALTIVNFAKDWYVDRNLELNNPTAIPDVPLN